MFVLNILVDIVVVEVVVNTFVVVNVIVDSYIPSSIDSVTFFGENVPQAAAMEANSIYVNYSHVHIR